MAISVEIRISRCDLGEILLQHFGHVTCPTCRLKTCHGRKRRLSSKDMPISARVAWEEWKVVRAVRGLDALSQYGMGGDGVDASIPTRRISVFTCRRPILPPRVVPG